VVCNYRMGMDWWTDLLTTYIHNLELQIITTLSLISTLYKWPQHQLSLLPGCYLFISHFLATASNTVDSSSSHAQVLLSQSSVQSSCQLSTHNWTVKVKFKVTVRLTVSESVNIDVEPHLGLMTRYVLLFDRYGLVFFCGRLLWREDGSVFYICCLPLPAQSFSRPYFTVSDLRLPFSSFPTTRRVTVEVFDPASTRVQKLVVFKCLFITDRILGTLPRVLTLTVVYYQ
jgi:hypothetical protein